MKKLPLADARRLGNSALAGLEALFETTRGTTIPLPPRLARAYGGLRMRGSRARPHVFSNFVSTLDGVVSLNVKGHASGGDISGFSAQDRMVMGLLRAMADVVIIGSGTLRADRRHVWTAQSIFPALARDYVRLRSALHMHDVPLNVVVTGSGDVDLRLPIFASGNVPALIVTTPKGARRLRTQRGSGSVCIRAVRSGARTISPEPFSTRRARYAPASGFSSKAVRNSWVTSTLRISSTSNSSRLHPRLPAAQPVTRG